MAPGWHQDGTKLQGNSDEAKLLEFCQTPRFIHEMMGLLNWKDRTKFRKKFVQPLLAQGLLKMTIPDKPSSGNQKYQTISKNS